MHWFYKGLTETPGPRPRGSVTPRVSGDSKFLDPMAGSSGSGLLPCAKVPLVAPSFGLSLHSLFCLRATHHPIPVLGSSASPWGSPPPNVCHVTPLPLEKAGGSQPPLWQAALSLCLVPP